MTLTELWRTWWTAHPNARPVGETVSTDSDLVFLSSLIHPYSTHNGGNPSKTLDRMDAKSGGGCPTDAHGDLGASQGPIER